MPSNESSKVEVERAQFRQLLIKNPNYFGNLENSKSKPIKNKVNDTSYEKLTCVGLKYPNTLEATIAILRPFGYGGNLCSNGSVEFVRFFIKYEGANWKDAGLAAVNVHDIPNKEDCAGHKEKPLTYVVNHPFDAYSHERFCQHPVIPKVRAILSWNVQPPAGDANFNWKPIWGNVMECFVQLRPKLIFALADLSEDANLKVAKEYQSISVGPVPPLPNLTLAQLSKLEKVEPHRSGLTEIHAMLTSSGVDQNLIAAKIKEWKSSGFDLAKSTDIILNTKADVTFEELECLGLDYNEEKLVATLRIKQPTGYSGDLCHAGAFEHIAFWADWDNTCKWTFLGYSKISVHSFGDLFPTNGICYSAVLQYNFSKVRESCTKPKIGRVRAVLSFEVPPSNTDPNELQYYGNIIDSHVQIKPIEAAVSGLVFNLVRAIDIDASTGLTKNDAKKINDLDVDVLGRPCPFGGLITISSNEIVDTWAGNYYKVEVQNPEGSTAVPLTQDLKVLGAGGEYDVPYFGNGYYKILPGTQNEFNVLHNWMSVGNEQCKIRVTVRDNHDDTGSEIFSAEQLIQLNNTPPLTPIMAGSSWNTLENRLDIQIISAGELANCKKFTIPAVIEGKFWALDKYFNYFSLYATPAIVEGTPSNPVTNEVIGSTPPYSYNPTDPSGNNWKLDTGSPHNMKKCGYNIVLHVQDLTIYGVEGPGILLTNLWTDTQVGFCLADADEE